MAESVTHNSFYNNYLLLIFNSIKRKNADEKPKWHVENESVKVGGWICQHGLSEEGADLAPCKWVNPPWGNASWEMDWYHTKTGERRQLQT